MWYVIQVNTGQEKLVKRLIEQAVRNSDHPCALEECFIPYYRALTKVDGEWVEQTEPLLPGYLIVSMKRSALDDVASALKVVPKFTRLLSSDGVFSPLAQEEVEWLSSFTSEGSRVVEMSEGFVERGMVTVVSGPLRGREGLIRKINRRKHVAYLQLQIMGRTLEVKVGLNLVRKSQFV